MSRESILDRRGAVSAPSHGRRSRPLVFGGALAIAAALPFAAWAQAPATTLPGGASAVQESFQNWRVGCVAGEGGRKLCSATQEQADAKSRQRVLAVEFKAGAPDRIEGVLVVPFGLLIERGVTLQIDDAAPLPPLRVRTCLPVGCVVPLAFDAKTTGALRKGATLKVKLTIEDGRDVTFPLPLGGLPAALDRLATFAKG